MRGPLRLAGAFRLLAALLVAGAMVPVIAACSGGSSSSGGSATSGTVNWWGWTPGNAELAGIYIQAFNRAYPHIKVNYKVVTISDYTAALRPALVSGQGPDVFDIQPGAYVTEFGSFAEDLTPMVKQALGDSWKSTVAPVGVSGLTRNGKLTSLSVGQVYAGNLWIDQDLFTQYGVTPPTTLDQWQRDCQVFQSHGVGCFVQGAAQEGFDQDTLQSIANSVQPGLWTMASRGSAKWSDPGIVQTLTIWKQLFTSKIMQSGAIGFQQYPDANNAFLTQKYAMIMMGTWYTQYGTQSAMQTAISAAGVSNARTFTALPVAFPDVAGKGNTSEMYGDADYGLAVYTRSKNRAAAETFVKWMTTSAAGQQVVADQLDDIPSLKGIEPNFNQIKFVDPSTQMQPVGDYLKNAGTVTEPREALLSADVQTAILAAASSVATGSATPQQAANTLQQAAVAAGEKFS